MPQPMGLKIHTSPLIFVTLTNHSMVSSRFHKLSMIVLINTSLRVLRFVASKNDILIFVHRRCG
jgi:hypothetical protein